jgi:thiamine kinase
LNLSSTDPRTIGAGASAQVLKVSGEQVLKVFKPHLAPILAQREFEFARLAFESGIPSPEPIEIRTVDSTQAILYEFRAGTNLDSHTLPRPWRYRKATRQMADLHAVIHGVHPMIEGFPDSYRQKVFFQTLIGYSNRLPEQLRRRCLETLDDLDDGASLCHGDMSPSNVMIHSGRCFAIDWSLATVGDPAGDVAFTVVGIRDLSQVADLSPMVKAILRRGSRWYLERYRDRSRYGAGIEFERWLAPAAAARLGALEKAGEPDSILEPLLSLVEAYCNEDYVRGI